MFRGGIRLANYATAAIKTRPKGARNKDDPLKAVQQIVSKVIKSDLRVLEKKRSTLRNLNCIVLDNSLRETTVGQVRGHTLEAKQEIWESIKSCNLHKYTIVASFGDTERVDDSFVKQLVESSKTDPSIDTSNLFSFSDVYQTVTSNNIPDVNVVPVGLRKAKEYGLKNPILEIDPVHNTLDKSFTTTDWCLLLQRWLQWTRDNLAKNAKPYVNIRDFALSMTTEEGAVKVLTIVRFLGQLPKNIRPVGIMFEEPTGKWFPEEVGTATKAIRQMMDQSGWKSGNLLAHVHEKWGSGNSSQLECLANGANGVWCGICKEGAAMGHASSIVSLMNLIRIGNKKVLRKYKCTNLRTAAIDITKATTGRLPSPMQVIYGSRALDLSFDFGVIAGGQLEDGEFDLAAFFGEHEPVRISTLASNHLIKQKLINTFGENEMFTEAMAAQMHTTMISDLTANESYEYMSPTGLGLLFQRSGGVLTEDMTEIMSRGVDSLSGPECDLFNQIHATWHSEEEGHLLSHRSFFHLFMRPYFSSFLSEEARYACSVLDINKDGNIAWKEFEVYLLWSLREYKDLQSVDDLLEASFTKALIPSMRLRRKEEIHLSEPSKSIQKKSRPPLTVSSM